MRQLVIILLIGLAVLVIIPACSSTPKTDAAQTKQELMKQWNESEELWRSTICKLKDEGKKEKNRKEVIAKLEKMLIQYDKHAVKPWILFVLAELIENTAPDKALDYSLQASEFPTKTDMWGYGQQEALKKSVELYAKKGEYREAVAQLLKWEVSAECGTGWAGRCTLKAFKIWELRLCYEDKDKVYSEMWETMASSDGWMDGFGVNFSGYMIVYMYGKDNLVKLKQDLNSFVEKNNLTQPLPANTKDYRTKALYDMTQQISNNIKFIEDVNNADEDGIVKLINSVPAPDLHYQNAKELGAHDFWSHGASHWRENIAMDKIIKYGPTIVPKLIAEFEKTSHSFAIYCLGKIGGSDVVEYFIKKIGDVKESEWIYYYLYCLLSTKDEKAISFVKEMVKSTNKNSNSEKARWALEQFPDLNNQENK
ncbi:MAG: hypothetical protein V1701_03605 [Planctomycetota bacterium]